MRLNIVLFFSVLFLSINSNATKTDITLDYLIFDNSIPFHLKILDAIPDEGKIQIGPDNAKNTIIEFFDYNCGYCRRAFKTVMNLIEDNEAIKVVMREWPILGDGSVFAAKASLASQNQQKYKAFHEALMGNRGPHTEKSVLKIAKNIGMDIDQLKSDMNSSSVLEHLEESQKLSQSLGISGTPAFVFGEKMVPGAIDFQAMKDLVAQMVSK